MATEIQDVSQDSKRQSDLANWRKIWSPSVARTETDPAGAQKAGQVTPALAADASRAIAYGFPLLIVRGADAHAGSVNRVVATAAYAETSE